MDAHEIPLFTFAGKDFEVKVPSSLTRDYPALAATANKNATVSVIEYDYSTVSCLVQFLETGAYGLIDRDFPSIIAAAGHPPIAADYTQDLLKGHARINAIGSRFRIFKLAQLARSHIEPTLRNFWHDSAFLGTVATALSSEDSDLHRMLIIKAGVHLQSLIELPEVDLLMLLRSFDSTCRTCAEPQRTTKKSEIIPLPDNSAELESLKKRVASFGEQVTSLEQQVHSASYQRDDLRQQLLAASSEKERFQKEVASLSSDNKALQQRIIDLESKASKSEQVYEETLRAEQFRFQQQISNASTEHSQVIAKLSSECEELRQVTEGEKERVAKLGRELKEKAEAQQSGLQERLRNVENEASISNSKLRDSSKELEAAKRELRVSTSERDLLRKRWEESRAKITTLSKTNEDLNLALDLEKSSDMSVLARKRDELKKALDDEQKVAAKLAADNREKDTIIAAANKASSLYTAQKQKSEEQFIQERNRSIALEQERDMAKLNEAAAKQAEAGANRKTAALLNVINNHKFCRHCDEEFGVWVEDDDDRYILRCCECRTRHYC
ncbi:hypothetical protein FHETE_1855 [Fusarium heterosporum]|uniref:Uncharacterized protein n=1 Tax=Fusarium heterosporum TaxID=42747 RepID=A0A8H5WVP5_FUSHE|nr:hypothetical protein FHETE_1855 [Fusarium heterosporum]